MAELSDEEPLTQPDDKVQTLADVMHLWLMEDEAEDESPEIASLRKWFQDLHTAMQDDAYPRNAFRAQYTAVSRRMLLVLRECILAQRWNLTLKLLTLLTKDMLKTGSALFHVGLEVFCQDFSGHSVLLQQYMEMLKNLHGNVDRKEVAMDFALYLMSRGHFHEARDQLKSVKCRGRSVLAPTERSEHWERLLKVYQGLSHYMDWWLCTQRISQLRNDEDDLDAVEKIERESDLQKLHAQQAIGCIQVLYKIPGVWDIFITKHVELLEFLENHEQALEVLTTYRELNPSNPNAARYLYEYHVRHNHDVKTVNESLMQFCDMVPCDSLCLKLHSGLLKQGEEAGSLLYLIFDLLDYFSWQDTTEAWQLLSHQLQTALLSEEGSKQAWECWEQRQSWWPAYHFREDQTKACSQQLKLCLRHKALVAAALLTPDNHFTQLVIDQGILDRNTISNIKYLVS